MRNPSQIRGDGRVAYAGIRAPMAAVSRTAVQPRVTFWARFAPIVAAEAYLGFTVFIFAFGPWPWPIDNPFTLYTYLIAVQIALLIGYLTGAGASPAVYTGKLTESWLLKTSILLNLLWILPYFYLQIGSQGLNLSGIVHQTLLGAADPRQAYMQKFEDMNSRNTLVLYAYMFCSPILWMGVPLAIRRWNRISNTMKAAVAIIVVANAATWIALGTIKGIADGAATISISIAATRKSSSRVEKVTTKVGRTKRLVLVLIAVSALILYFSYAESSRKKGQLVQYDPGPGISVDVNNVFMAGLPTGLQATEANAVSYLCQGYYGLSLALREPFVWSYGIGHSVAMTSIVHKVTGFDAAELTYMAREQHYGWDMQMRWDSIYPWLASDVTFPGTLIVIFFIGRLLAVTWVDTRADASPYAPPLFVMTMLMICYFPANDQFLSASTTVLAFWGLLILWYMKREPNLRRGPGIVR